MQSHAIFYGTLVSRITIDNILSRIHNGDITTVILIHFCHICEAFSYCHEQVPRLTKLRTRDHNIYT